MKKMKTRYIILIIVGIVVLSVVVLFNWNNVLFITLPEYEYNFNGYASGSIINMEDTIFEEIGEDTFKELLIYWSSNEGRYRVPIGRMVFNDGFINGKYLIYGLNKLEDRVLLSASSTVIINDNYYPELYFCRQDILHSTQDATKD